MNPGRSKRRLATALIAFALSSCVALERPFEDPLDHTPSAMIHDRAECACLTRLRLVTDPVLKKPCLSRMSDGGCAIRVDCVAPQAPEPVRQAALSCEAGPGAGR